MPRSARLDIAGVLQHVIVRGIERRDIFNDQIDRENFFLRFSSLLKKTQTDCLAWAFLSNHVHLLLRPSRKSLASLMRSLLTGYAVSFNIRHNRTGHLFQNRYKSIVCEEDEYLLELVRYIHLNPIRAGVVIDMSGLSRYRWCGHSVLMGHQHFPEQNVEEVLSYFDHTVGNARRQYSEFVADGIKIGKRDDLVGGGLKRALKHFGTEEKLAYDERVLGSGEFVAHLKDDEEIATRLPDVIPLADVIAIVSRVLGVDPALVGQGRRSKAISEVRAVTSYFAVRIFHYSGEVVGRVLGESRSGVIRGAVRGEQIVQTDSARWEQVWAEVNNSATSP